MFEKVEDKVDQMLGQLVYVRVQALGLSTLSLCGGMKY